MNGLTAFLDVWRCKDFEATSWKYLSKDLFHQFYLSTKCLISSTQSLSRVPLCNLMNRSTLGLPVLPTPRVHSNSRPLSLWCHPAISFSVVPFSSCSQSLPGSESFPMSQLSTRIGQSTGASALASFLPKNIEDWSPSEWTGWNSLQSKGLSKSSPTSQFKRISSLVLSFLDSPTLTFIHDHWKNHSLD